MDETANLQRPRLTVKQAAKLMNVSERLVYMARKAARLRPDLVPEIQAGRMSVHEALRLAEGSKPKPTPYDRLAKAWNAASDEDRARLLVAARVPYGDTVHPFFPRPAAPPIARAHATFGGPK